MVSTHPCGIHFSQGFLHLRVGIITMKKTKKIDWSIRPELQEMVEDGIITETQAREVIMKAKKTEEEKKRDELQAMFSKVHTAPITQSSDGRWRTKITTPDGKKKAIAKTYLEDMERVLNLNYFGVEGTEKVEDTVTIRSLYPIWLEEKKKLQEPSTITSIESKWRNDIEPYERLVDTPIKLLNVDIVKTWALQLLNGSDKKPACKVHYFYNIKAIVNEILDKAMDRDLVQHNVSRNTKIQGMQSRKAKEKAARLEDDDDEELDEIITLTDEELRRVEVAARELISDEQTDRPLLYLMFLFASEVGVRVGELLELQHKDIKEDGLHVRRFYAYTEDTKDKETGEKIRKIKKWLKNYKIARTIPLTDEALAILDEVKRIKKKLGIETDHLFSEDEHPVDYNVANRAMKKLCRKAGLPDHRMYVFRKTWITAMVDHSGLTLAQIANLAGNTPAVIMKSYYGRRDAPPDAATISAALRGGEAAKVACKEPKQTGSLQIQQSKVLPELLPNSTFIS